MDAANPSQIYIAHASQDKPFREKLEKHLSSLLKWENLISIIEEVPAGEHIERMREKNLEKASLILFLVSAKFLDKCEKEIELAMDRQRSGKATVIPILLRPVDFAGSSFAHLEFLPRNREPVLGSGSEDAAFTRIAHGIRAHVTLSKLPQNPEKAKKWRVLRGEHYDQGQNLLRNFVGRQSELKNIQQLISEKMPTGGYIPITGDAGEGKSSIIAKLIELYNIDQTIFHFIPSGGYAPGYQVSLLKNLMEQLTLKYDLSDLYAASDQRAALSSYFAKILREVAEEGGQEIIFIDGLDQLVVDDNGIRDLSFLPTNLPPGIVIVLGTRPGVVDSLKSHTLPKFSRPDFDVLLKSRNVSLNHVLADQFYDVLGANALYLDLAAKELALASDLSKRADIISRLAEDPDNIFSVAIKRLQHQQKDQLWETAIHPVLGILLVAQEPLTQESLRSLLNVKGYKIKDGLRSLGGLVTEDSQQRYTLFHLKFRDYLRSNKDFLFSTIDERHGTKNLPTGVVRVGLHASGQI